MSSDSMHTTQLHDWLARMRAGDNSARDELLQSVCQRLERLTRGMLKDFPAVRRWEETGDVLNNALMRLMRALQDVDPQSVREFYSLAAQHIRWELLDMVKHYNGPHGHGANHQSSAGREDGQISPAEPADENDDSLDMAKWTAFHEEVDNLPAEEREVVGLIFYHGWSQAEVAEVFQVSTRTVRRLWQQARWQLFQKLGDEVA